MRLFTIISATLFALVLSLASVVVAFSLTLTADGVGHLSNAASVAQIIGLVAIAVSVPQLVVLVMDQHRIAKDLEKKPDIRFGLKTSAGSDGVLSISSCEEVINAQYAEYEQYSDEVMARFYAVNCGTRSAKYITWNLSFKKNITILPGPTMEDDEYGKVISVSSYFHPNDRQVFDIRIKIPRNAGRIEVLATAFHLDSPEVRQALCFLVAPKPASKPAESTQSQTQNPRVS